MSHSLLDWSHSQTSGIHEFHSTGEITSVLKEVLKNVLLTLIEDMQFDIVYYPEQN